MRKIILFQGAILSTGRTFESVQNKSQSVEYSIMKDIKKLSSSLVEENFDCYFLFWEKDIKVFKNNIFFRALDNSKIIPIPNIDFPRGKLKSNKNQINKLFHYYAMNYGITYLISNDIAKDEDIIIRTRTDINFDIKELKYLVDLNIKDLMKGKILNQYWMENNSRWFIDFVFGGKVEIIYSLYSNLYLRCSNNIDNAYSVHQDLMKSIASIYIPKFLIFSEGPPKPLTRKEVQILFSQEPSQKVKVQSKYIFFMTCIMRLFIISSLFISRVIFWIYTKYEEAIFYSIYHYCTFQMSFKFQSSIKWRGEKCTPNYSEFIKEHKNSLCVFSQEIDNEK